VHGNLNTPTTLVLPVITTANANFIAVNTVTHLESLRIELPYAVLPSRCTHTRHAALALVRWDMCTHAGDNFNGHVCVRVTCGRLERLKVVLWYGHGEELEVMRWLMLVCAGLEIRIEFERDVKAFRAHFYPGVMVRHCEHLPRP
jgi:hypothetical protein